MNIKNYKTEYLDENPLHRKFVENPDQEKEIRIEFQNESDEKKRKFETLAKKSGKQAWEEYFY